MNTNNLTSQQKIGLNYMQDVKQKITRSQIEEVGDVLKVILRKVDASCEFAIVGSYRRGSNASKDIDIVIHQTSDETDDNLLMKFVARLDEVGVKVLSLGMNNFIGFVKIGDIWRHVDIWYANKQNLPFMLFAKTNSKSANIRFRLEAHRKGYKLNEYGLYNLDTKEPMNLHTEEDIFTFFGY